jgi:polyisoprenoid-binding protein YceI
MNIKRILQRTLLAVMLLTSLGVAKSEEAELCSPFMDGQVDESLLDTMLAAAHDGHLYRVQQDSSQVGFCVESKLSRIKGQFTDFKGGIALNDGDNIDGQTMFLIHANSLDTKGAIIENIIKGEDFFDVKRFPEVLFVSTGFQWTGKDTAVLKGNLTLRGITRPVIFNVSLTPVDARKIDQAQRIVVKATTTINRADFGMKDLTTLVNNNVQLCMSVEAMKYKV